MGSFSIWHWIIVLLFLGLIVVPPYKGLKKAGWSGWWCLIFVVPMANLIFLWVFAFAEWPNEPDAKGEMTGGSAATQIMSSAKHDPAQIDRVVNDFGALMQTMQVGTFYDVSVLPHAKDKILKALLYAMRVTEDAPLREQIKVGLVFLTQFQEGVGPNPVSIMPIDIAGLKRRMDAGGLPTEAAAEAVTKATATVDKDKLQRLEAICQAETKMFLAMAKGLTG